jgi:ribosomal protein S27E
MEVNMSYIKAIEDIQNLPHYYEFTCSKCEHRQKVYALQIHDKCEQCGTEYKFRGVVPIGTEIEDVIDAVLAWLGKGGEFEDAMKRKQVIDSYEEGEDSDPE